MGLSFVFGIYAGSAVGEGPGMLKGNPDNCERINAALDELAKPSTPFFVRCYEHYIGAGKTINQTPQFPEQYFSSNRKLDYVLCHQTNEPVQGGGWLDYITHTIHQHGQYICRLQITQEANVPGHGQDGQFENTLEALMEGLVFARSEIKRLGLNIQTGFNIAPSFGKDPFWERFRQMVTPAFISSLDYVGLDFFPDVFRPIPFEQISDAVIYLLQGFRERLEEVGVNSAVPFVVTENGWPTGQNRTFAMQSAILESIVQTLFENREMYNICGYQYFSLRDAATENKTGLLNNEFGLMDDEYRPKLAFHTFQRLIREYTRY
ncbi:MAG: hypothetical protein KF746_20935 [Chitinophagaceae bacterium]|nr:hypothetical protein [Chitinophagaceae bacterium]